MTHEAITELAGALGSKGCASGAALAAKGRLWDISDARHGIFPQMLLSPANLGEISTALEICHRHRLPIVPQGGLTGLAGGANARAQDVALSLSRFAGIEDIDTIAGTMTLRAGTILETAQRTAAEAGFVLPIDLGSRGSCQIGGVISTNAGGSRVIRYGTTRDNLLGLECVTAQGQVLSHLSCVTKDNTGYDLRHLFCGSEGTLGIVTRAVLRLYPQPGGIQTALCALDDFGQVIALLQRARRGVVLQAFEVMWQDHFVMSGGRTTFATPPPFAVLIEAEGQALEPLLEQALEASEITDALIAQSVAEARAFWDIRESVHPEKDLQGVLNLDVSIPIRAMGAFARDGQAVIRALDPDAEAYFFGHVGDGNLHVMARLPRFGHEGEDELQKAVYPLVRQFGGSISAEHGIGSLKREWLGYSRSTAEIAAMRAIKAALDPCGLMNPGKVI